MTSGSKRKSLLKSNGFQTNKLKSEEEDFTKQVTEVATLAPTTPNRGKMTCLMTKQKSAYANNFVPAVKTDMARRLSLETAKNNFQTPNDKRSKRKFVEEDIEVAKRPEYVSRKGMVGDNDSPVKAVACEDAMAKPCLSFSFDENFKLDSDVSQSAIDINDAWSPVSMGGAEVNLDNRVSPLKMHRQTSNMASDTGLLGGFFPVLSGQMTSSRRKPSNRVQPAKVSG